MSDESRAHAAAEVMTIAWRRLADIPADDARPWLIATARNLGARLNANPHRVPTGGACTKRRRRPAAPRTT